MEIIGVENMKIDNVGFLFMENNNPEASSSNTGDNSNNNTNNDHNRNRNRSNTDNDPNNKPMFGLSPYSKTVTDMK
jgi:hypothetical protein